MKLTWISLFCAAMCACGTTPRPVQPPLPYHVAFEAIHGAAVEQTHGPDNMRLELDAEALQYLNDQLLAVLRDQSFARVSLLPAAAQADGSNDAELLSIRKARSSTDADLLVTFDLKYASAIYHEVSSFRAHATPWWMLPGPLFWWAPDHAYSADMDLTVKLFDLARCADGEADRPLELRRWFFSHAISLDDVYLDFTERAGGRWELYLLSFITPSTTLARSHPQLELDLRRHFIDSLAQAVAFELQRKMTLLIRNEHDYSFYLEPSTLVVERLDESRARVRFSLAHKVGRSRNEPAALRLFAADAVRVPELQRLSQPELIAASEDQMERPGHARYSFERIVPIGPGTRALRLHVAAGGAQVAVREFTLALPGRSAED